MRCIDMCIYYCAALGIVELEILYKSALNTDKYNQEN